jgi:hypothetical protein
MATRAREGGGGRGRNRVVIRAFRYKKDKSHKKDLKERKE